MVCAGVALAATADDYKIDPGHSSAVFKVNHLGASNVYGMMPNVTGSITFNESDASKNTINISVDATTVSTFHNGRDKHLSGPDFFNAKQFPAITFKSTSWEKAGDGAYDITGAFTMLGVTKTITVKAEHIGFGKNRGGKNLAGFESTFTIDRTDYGMNYGVAEKGGLGKDVTITIAVEGINE
jgi:polyisoprenoid-binding protein YceI